MKNLTWQNPEQLFVAQDVINNVNKLSCGFKVVNHFLCNLLLKDLRMYYPKSKIVFVVHDQTWTNELLGDNVKLRSIITKNLNPKIKLAFEKEKQMYNLADRIVCMNLDTKALLSNFYGIKKSKIVFIPNGLDGAVPCKIDNVELRNKLYVSHFDKIIIYAGRTTKSKGIYDLLRAFDEVVKLHPEARLVVLGEVFQHAELVKHCQKSISRVIFTGLVSRDKLAEWYRIADVGVVPSFCEQCGYSGIEMMAMGVPVVASDAFGVRCMFKDGVNAIVAKIGNRTDDNIFPMHLSAGISKMLGLNYDEKVKMCNNAYRLFESRYSLEKMESGYTKLLKSI